MERRKAQESIGRRPALTRGSRVRILEGRKALELGFPNLIPAITLTTVSVRLSSGRRTHRGRAPSGVVPAERCLFGGTGKPVHPRLAWSSLWWSRRFGAIGRNPGRRVGLRPAISQLLSGTRLVRPQCRAVHKASRLFATVQRGIFGCCTVQRWMVFRWAELPSGGWLDPVLACPAWGRVRKPAAVTSFRGGAGAVVAVVGRHGLVP